MGRRFVDAVWIRQRMNRKDDRIARELRRKFPVVPVAIVPVLEAPVVAPLVDVALVPYTCYVDDPLQRDEGRSRAICGDYVDENDISRFPTCPGCQRRLQDGQ